MVLPIMQSNFFQQQKDKATLLHGLKKAMAVADAKAFKPVSVEGLYHPRDMLQMRI